MLLTQRHEAQKDVDRKFRAYQIIAAQSSKRAQELDQEFEEVKAKIREDLKENDAAAKTHINTLKELKEEKIQSGGCAEFANMVVSVFNQENQRNTN